MYKKSLLVVTSMHGFCSIHGMKYMFDCLQDRLEGLKGGVLDNKVVLSHGISIIYP